MHRILENPNIFDMMQKIASIFVARAVKLMGRCISENCKGKVLDIGCGTGRYAGMLGSGYFGVDMNLRYLKREPVNGKNFICCDAADLPFKTRSLDSIFSVSFFHHINSNGASKVLSEIVRVSKPDATIVVIDAFYPDTAYDVIGYALMKLDRGRHARKKERFIEELGKHFYICRYYRIPHSYPYNFYAFILKQL